MDWYYPVLCGAVGGGVGQARMDDRWDEFVIEGFGIRCVSDAEWVTASETAECVLALDACGRTAQARTLLTWVQYLREPDGSYWTGCVHPEEIHFPADERTSYTAAVMLLACGRARWADAGRRAVPRRGAAGRRRRALAVRAVARRGYRFVRTRRLPTARRSSYCFDSIASQ